MDDLNFGITYVAFEAKVFNKYGAFDQITNPNYAYLHCDLFNRVTMTIITLKVKLSHIKTHKQHLHKGMFMKVEIFLALNRSPIQVLKKVTCMLSVQLTQQPLCHQFVHSNSN